MKKSSLDKEKRKKKGKTENTPAKAGGTENTKMSEKGRESGPAKKPNENKEEGGQKEKRKAPQKGARKALRRAVKKAVKARSDGIAFSLLDRTAHGDMRGAAMMISLMEPKNKDGSDEKNDWHGPSVAELLESEPPWDGSLESSETVASGRAQQMQRVVNKD